MWADALDHARAQVLLDAFERRGWDDPQLLGLELEAVLAVVGPGPDTLSLPSPPKRVAKQPITRPIMAPSAVNQNGD
jgi:hypothetical protein